jgi:hypothetical protein
MDKICLKIFLLLQYAIIMYCDNKSSLLINSMSGSYISCEGVRKNSAGMNKPDCCGVNAYDTSSNICCTNFIQSTENMGNPFCCGTRAYDRSTSFCCNKFIRIPPSISNKTNFECCGSNLYDKTKMLCCNNLVRLPDPSFKLPQCCGATIFDGYASNNICCRTVVYENPIKNLICCNGVLHFTDNIENPLCCGTEIIDSSKYTCSNKK